MGSCPGWYCGRTVLLDGQFSECGACPRGYRRNDTSFICEPCEELPSFYDWLYLGFMVLLVLVLHWFFIDMVAKGKSLSKDVMILHYTALVEVVVSCVLSIIVMPPVGKFEIKSCRTRNLADWYTLLHNPMPNYENRIHCTVEAVYPLYTIVFVFYALSLFMMLLLRPWVCRRCLPRKSKMSIYAAMYFIPILTLLHALIGGLLYYSFPYLIIILSVISCASHFAVRLEQTPCGLIKNTLIDPRNMTILLGHWSLHAYGIISITELKNPAMHSLFVLLVPLPTMFYVLTAKFTDPSRFQL